MLRTFWDTLSKNKFGPFTALFPKKQKSKNQFQCDVRLNIKLFVVTFLK